jgi:hypothetical protein
MIRGGGDVYHHMFVASQILNSGYLPLTDFYPIMHIWLSIVYNFLPDFIILVLIFSIVFFILYVLSLYILGKTILGTKKGGIFFSIFGIPLIFSFLHYGFIPFFFAILTFPLILYTYQKLTYDPTQKSGFYICLIFLSFFIVFCHPMISVFLIIMFFIFTFFELFKVWVTGRQSNIEAANIVIIISLTLVVWWLQFRDILYTLQDITYEILEGQGARSIFKSEVNTMMISNASTFEVIDRFMKIYGPACFYFSISLFFLFYIIYQYLQNEKIYEVDFNYSLQFCVAICIGIVLISGYFVIAEPIRAAMYGLIFATILCGLFFYRQRQLGGLITSLTVIITIICMLTIITLYSSPWTSGPNQALTYGDKNGIDWILEYRNAEIPIVSQEGSIYKYKNYYYESTNARIDQNLIEYNMIIPSNFGYMTNRTIGDSFAYLPNNEVYMITTEMMKLTPFAAPVERRSRVKSFTDTDFIHLKNDPSVNLVYSSNEFNGWNIAIP